MVRRLVVPFVLLVACAPAVRDPEEPITHKDDREVRQAAERDLDCAPEDITVARVDDPDREVFVAAGCGVSRKYTVSCSTSRGTETCNAWVVDDEDDHGLDYEEDDE